MRTTRQGQFDAYENQENQNDNTVYAMKPNNQMAIEIQRLKKSLIALIIFVLIISGILIFRQFHISQEIKAGKFYQNQLLSYQLDEFWKMTPSQMKQQQSDPNYKIIKKGPHPITRTQLGHNSWTLLHMVTGAFPDQINQNLIKKFNAFLILFGQMYPCKLCANHFMDLLKQVGPFTGTNKAQLMTYLCQIHNKVNKALGKQIHSCENIVDQWNSCGCSEEN